MSSRLTSLGLCLILALLAVPAAAGQQDETPPSELALPSIGGWVMLADGVTLIVFLPDQGKLAYIDTVTNKELKRIEAPIRPNLLAAQGKRLLVTARGANVVHVLDLDSGAAKKEIKLPNGGVVDMVCHRDKGPVYAAAAKNNGILAIDPEAGKAGWLEARGDNLALIPTPLNTPALPPRMFAGNLTCLAMHPHQANTLYAAYVLQGRRMAGRALLAKFAVTGKAFQVIGVNPMAALGDGIHGDPPVVRVSADGKKVGVTSFYGYMPPGGRTSLDRPVGLFTAGDVSALAGVVECGIRGFQGWGSPRDLAFHPVLDLGVAEETNAGTPPSEPNGHYVSRLHLFNSKSLIETSKFNFNLGAGRKSSPRLLTFGARGTKLLYYDGTQGCLRLIPLRLTDKDRAALAKAYPARRE